MESEIQNSLLLRYSKSGINSQLMLKKADARSGAVWLYFQEGIFLPA